MPASTITYCGLSAVTSLSNRPSMSTVVLLEGAGCGAHSAQADARTLTHARATTLPHARASVGAGLVYHRRDQPARLVGFRVPLNAEREAPLAGLDRLG